jgi:hypothetical protein
MDRTPLGENVDDPYPMLGIDDVVYEILWSENVAFVCDLTSSNGQIRAMLVSGSISYSVTGIRSSALWFLINNSLPVPPFLVCITPVSFQLPVSGTEWRNLPKGMDRLPLWVSRLDDPTSSTGDINHGS